MQRQGQDRNLGFLLPSPGLACLSHEARVVSGVGAKGRWQGLLSIQGIASVVVTLPSELTEGEGLGKEAALIRNLVLCFSA